MFLHDAKTQCKCHYQAMWTNHPQATPKRNFSRIICAETEVLELRWSQIHLFQRVQSYFAAKAQNCILQRAIQSSPSLLSLLSCFRIKSDLHLLRWGSADIFWAVNIEMNKLQSISIFGLLQVLGRSLKSLGAAGSLSKEVLQSKIRNHPLDFRASYYYHRKRLNCWEACKSSIFKSFESIITAFPVGGCCSGCFDLFSTCWKLYARRCEPQGTRVPSSRLFFLSCLALQLSKTLSAAKKLSFQVLNKWHYLPSSRALFLSLMLTA